MTEDRIRVGVIGAGGNTRLRHIPGLLQQPGVTVAVVANRTVASAQRAAEEFDIPRVAADWMAVIEDDGIDAVCIGTWPNMHAPITIAALEAGKHVLCEARMALNAAEARQMLAAARRQPRAVAQIVPAPHTLAFDQTIVAKIGTGEIGDLIQLDARVTVGSDFPNSGSPLHWRQDRDLSGNNVMSLGIWYEAMMRWVGPAADVFAIGRAVVAHRTDHAGRRVAMEIPDHIDILGRLAQGGQMRFGLSTVVGHAPTEVDICIFGTEGTLRLVQTKAEPMTLYTGTRGETGLSAVEIDPAAQGGWRVEEEFVQAIRGLEPVTHTDLTTAVKYMEWTDAVARSARAGERVTLP